MRLALAQVDPTVGDLRGNASSILAAVRRAEAAGAGIVVFPELVLAGSPPADLLLKRQFVDDCGLSLEALTRECTGAAVVVGTPLLEGGSVFDAAGVLVGGAVAGTYKKMHFPRHGLLDENRYFVPGESLVIIESGQQRFALAFLDDIWGGGGGGVPTVDGGDAAAVAAGVSHPEPTMLTALRAAVLSGDVDAVLVLAMSQYHLGKGSEIEAVLSQRGAEFGVPVAYVSGVGAQDGIVFEGRSMVCDAAGQVVARAPQFSERLLVVDLPLGALAEHSASADSGSARPVRPPLPVVVIKTPDASGNRADEGGGGGEGHGGDDDRAPEVFSGIAHLLSEEAEVYEALCLGVRDYLKKTGFRHVVLGLSGGIDSVLATCIAADALGPDKVTAISMPSRYSSAGTREDARETARRLGVAFQEISIEPLYQKYLDELNPLFADLPEDTTEQNIQARVRGNLLMALSNKFGWLVLTAGNKSELAVGYTTLYGDMAGGFAVLKDVPKTMVYRLARYRNAQGGGALGQGAQGEAGGPIPASAIERAPSAELAADQTDQDTLPPYELLDRIIDEYVVQDKGVEEMVAAGLERGEVERVVRMIDGNEYKRYQAPPGIRITPKGFGSDRRMPMTNRYRG